MLVADLIAHRTAEADPALVRPVDERTGWVRCLACAHRCKVAPGREGVCKVRFNQDGLLRVPRGYVAALAADPIEKKPFFHFDPGGTALSFGMLGCDLHCSYCQNWDTSQVARDPDAGGHFREIAPKRIIREALEAGAGTVVSTYNEPLITTEWALEIFQLAREAGLATAFVSNGNATPEVLELLAPWIDAFKVDLKGFDEAGYRRLGGELEPVLETIRELVRRDIWCEVVTLLVPGQNDSNDELSRLTGFLAGVSPDIPWHCTAFHPDYLMAHRRSTSTGELARALSIGRRSGLRHVYAGNRPGAIRGAEDTFCPSCEAPLVERFGFRMLDCRIGTDGTCPDCGATISGRWARRSQNSQLGSARMAVAS